MGSNVSLPEDQAHVPEIPAHSRGGREAPPRGLEEFAQAEAEVPDQFEEEEA